MYIGEETDVANILFHGVLDKLVAQFVSMQFLQLNIYPLRVTKYSIDFKQNFHHNSPYFTFLL